MIVVLVFLLLGGFFLILGGFFLIFEAPLFLSEVAASFFLVGSLAKPLREIDDPDWAGSIFRWTWKRFVLALAFALLLAFAAHIVCPQAHTMVEVFKKCL